MVFIGCSLQGLLADMNAIGAPAKITRKHFAIVGVSNDSWKDQAAELSRRYGVEVLVCAAETIGAALPAFLETLVGEVEQPRRAEQRIATA